MIKKLRTVTNAGTANIHGHTTESLKYAALNQVDWLIFEKKYNSHLQNPLGIVQIYTYKL